DDLMGSSAIDARVKANDFFEPAQLSEFALRPGGAGSPPNATRTLERRPRGSPETPPKAPCAGRAIQCGSGGRQTMLPYDQSKAMVKHPRFGGRTTTLSAFHLWHGVV